jgi:hypothetical protein
VTTIRLPVRDQITVIDDSRRWRAVELRPDDIIVATPPKCGTTWTQGILASLLWAGRPLPDLGSTSPWLDARFRPIEEVATALAAQPHRRFIKTHTVADALAIDDEVTYVIVYRDQRDALVSWANHRAGMRPEVVEFVNTLAAEDGVARWPPVWNGDFDVLLDEWTPDRSPARHLETWWPLRQLPNVVFVHYNDLKPTSRARCDVSPTGSASMSPTRSGPRSSNAAVSTGCVRVKPRRGRSTWRSTVGPTGSSSREQMAGGSTCSPMPRSNGASHTPRCCPTTLDRGSSTAHWRSVGVPASDQASSRMTLMPLGSIR